MEEKIISEINLDLVFQCKDFSQISNKFQDTQSKLICESSFWEKVFLSWVKALIEKNDYESSKYIYKKKSFSLGLQIINNTEIASLNEKWMNKNRPTDVLSFPIFYNESLSDLEHIELGDIFISLDMAIKQSYEYQHSLYKEMLWLASHGFLHLLGWQHNDDLELDNMLNFQEYLITRLD